MTPACCLLHADLSHPPDTLSLAMAPHDHAARRVALKGGAIVTEADRRDFRTLCRRHRIRAYVWPFGLTLGSVVFPDECLRIAVLISRWSGRVICTGVVSPPAE